MRKTLAEWVKWARVKLAERLVWSLGYGVFFRAYVTEADERVAALAAYTATSGHLTRAYKAGKRVRGDALAVASSLFHARVRPRVPEHIGSIVARALVRIFSGGRGTVSF